MPQRRSHSETFLEILPPPRGLSVACAAPVNPFVARYAKRHQVLFVMCAAVRKSLDMMHECCENVSPPSFAFLT